MLCSCAKAEDERKGRELDAQEERRQRAIEAEKEELQLQKLAAENQAAAGETLHRPADLHKLPRLHCRSLTIAVG